MPNVSPEVTAILVTYNRCETLETTVTDILQQTFSDFSLIICDDSSPDKTESVCTRLAAMDDRISYIRRPTNVGMPDNLNQALELTHSPYVAILHDGNRYDPRAFELWHDVLAHSPRVSFAFNQVAVIDGLGTTISVYREPLTGVVSGRWLLRHVFFRRWDFSSPVFGVAMVRREALADGLLDATFGFYADVDFWMRLLHKWDAGYVPQPLVRVLRREAQPQQFNYGVWELSEIMHSMFGRHREVEFGNDSLMRRTYEMLLHQLYTVLDDCYRMLLLYRRGDFELLRQGGSQLRNRPLRSLGCRALLALRRARPLLFPCASRSDG